MTRCLISMILIALFVTTSMVGVCLAGGPGGPGGAMQQGPPLDYTLMGFKEQGVWYFPCCAPEFTKRIPPHYQSYGPPPPPYCGVPCAPCGPQPMIKK